MSRKSTTHGGDRLAVDEYAMTLAQERIVVEAQVSILRLLQSKGLKQSDLAELLGVSQARVSQMFSEGARNLTLRTLARTFHALGSRCRVVQETGDRTVDDADTALEEAGSAAIGTGMHEAGLRSGIGSTEPADDPAPLELAGGYAPRDADAWLLQERDMFETLSEDAPFASRMVWVSSHMVVPANENHPAETTYGRRGGLDARRWAAALG